MARKIRIEYCGATYHVMARGNQGRGLYRDEQDRAWRLAGRGWWRNGGRFDGGGRLGVRRFGNGWSAWPRSRCDARGLAR
jgi:hypothetical protein